MTAPQSTVTRSRQRRERVTRPDGSVAVQTKPPVAVVLWYPWLRWTTVLVRRTHDLDLATALAEQRWAEICADAPLVKSRVGWWRTYSAPSGRVPRHAATDHLGRVVEWSTDLAHAAGPGIEFRP